MASSWTCPYCNRPCTIGDDDIRIISDSNYINKEYGSFISETKIIVCPNTECRKFSLSVSIYKIDQYHKIDKRLYFWQLLPESEAKPFPEYIPQQLREDYREACLIKNKSPKASATLSRRCLQGIIRDFWGIKKDRLIDEIEGIGDKVDQAVWKAIDAVRHVGNIGAHMEKDVNLIIDVDQEEAGMLIWLIEYLFEECYISRFEKNLKLDKLIKVAESKKVIKIANNRIEKAIEKKI